MKGVKKRNHWLLSVTLKSSSGIFSPSCSLSSLMHCFNGGCGLGGVAVGVGFVPLPGGVDDGFDVGEGWLPAEGGKGAGGGGD